MASKIGRNDPCACGSGKKSKNCCGRSASPLRSKKLNQTLAGVVLSALLVVAAAAYVQLDQEESAEEQVQKAPPITIVPGSFTPQPAGSTPAGSVWSEEHGHWHNATPAVQPQTPDNGPIATSRDFKPGPQPPGKVPEGMVWNTEHGHWHNAPGASPPQTAQTVPLASSAGYTPGPQPPGDVPEGMVWNVEHGHWHNEGDNSEHAVSAPSDVPTSRQPSPNHRWSREHGHWHGPPSAEEMEQAAKTEKPGRIHESVDNERPQLKFTPAKTTPKDSL